MRHRISGFSRHALFRAAARKLAVGVFCLGLAACGGVSQPPDTAQIQPGAFGPFDNDTAAINQASYAFASPAAIAFQPATAARAVAAIDYLAGELSTNPRWLEMSPLTKLEMVQARADVRRALGIDPTASSQAVVDALLQFSAAWLGGNQTLAMQTLSAPVFTLPPQQTLTLLNHLPYIRSANVASRDALTQLQAQWNS